MKVIFDKTWKSYRARGTVRLPNGKSVRLRGSGDTRTKAKDEFERKQLEVIAEATSPAPPPASGEKPFVAFAREWLSTYPTSASNRETTRVEKTYHVNVRLIPYFEKLAADRGGAPILLREVTAKTIDEMVAALKTSPRLSPVRRAPADINATDPTELASAQRRERKLAQRKRERGGAEPITKTLSPQTVKNILGTFRKMLVSAKRWDEISVLPEFERVKTPKGKIDFLTFEETDRLLAGAEGQDRALLMTGVKAGLRAGELLGLTWAKIDLVRMNLRVDEQLARKGTKLLPPKAGPRDVPISAALAEALKAHRTSAAKAANAIGGWVFTRDDGRPLDRADLKRRLHIVCRRAGIRQAHPHLMRHTFASHCAMRAVPLAMIQKWCGHASISTTMLYAHLAPNFGASMVNVLDQKAPGQSTDQGDGGAADAQGVGSSAAQGVAGSADGGGV